MNIKHEGYQTQHSELRNTEWRNNTRIFGR